MSAVIQQLQQSYDVSDRRNVNIAVENERRNNKEICVCKKPEPETVVFKCFAESLPPARRLASLKEKWDDGDMASVAGALALTAVNFPEDKRDIESACIQLGNFFKGKPCQDAYNYRDFQHEFSFFRGTMLEPLVDPSKTKNQELAYKLASLDKSLLKTSFGKKILGWLKVEECDFEKVKSFNKTTKQWEISKDINGCSRLAIKFKGSNFGVLTARAMSRTTLIGVGVTALFELPNLYKSLKKGDTISEKADSVVKQTFKSGLNIAATTAGIAYGGAIGSKYGKSFGSLIGMGIGAVVGNLSSKKLQEALS